MANQRNKRFIKSRKNVGGRGRCSKVKNVLNTSSSFSNVINVNTSLDTSLRESKVQQPVQCKDNNNDYVFLIHFEIFKEMLRIGRECDVCGCKDVSVANDLKARKGFAHKFVFTCSKCKNTVHKYTSSRCKPSLTTTPERNNGCQPFEINLRSVMSFREIGKGHESLKTFSRCMNMHSISEPGFRNINNKLFYAYENAAQESMKNAANAGKGEQIAPGIYSCRVSLDGSWQRRGYASLNGVVTAINKGKCIDAIVLSKHCRQCMIWEKRKGTPEYNNWKVHHACNINHTKSSGAMESAGAVELFSRSIESNHLIYHEYLGDGDTSSYKEVVKSKPYEDKYGITPVKLECIGHVNKRIGTRLRTLVQENKKTTKPFGGKGKLTNKAINSITNYYGIAIRHNIKINTTAKEKVYAMKKWIAAILHHCTDFPDNVKRHMFCPTGESSWCKFQKNKKDHKQSINLPTWMFPILTKIFQQLSSDELLLKCVHGETQNSNESLNNLIWMKCPKQIFVQKPVVELGVNSAILQFNEGLFGISKVLSQFGIENGACFHKYTLKANYRSIQNAISKSSNKVKVRRKKLTVIRKKIGDKDIDTEGGESYVKGGF
jgi:hypothetical protein